MESDASGIDTSPGASTVVDRKFVQDLPLNGRSFQSLLLMTPGVNLNVNDGGLSFNGLRTNSNYFTIDGVSANVSAPPGIAAGPVSLGMLAGNLFATNAIGGTQGLLSVDALQEFKVQTSAYSADYGRQPGGQIQLTSRSGTNQFHGTVFDYLRNNIFNAQEYAPYYQLPTSKERQNDFGATLGGPVDIPGLYNGKDKTFFFFSYEGSRVSQPQPGEVTDVPSLDLRNGVLATNPDGPNPNNPYQGGSPSDFSQVPAGIRAWFKGYPAPTGPPEVYTIYTSNPNFPVLPNQLTGLAPYALDPLLLTNLDNWSFRLDHYFGSRLTTFLRVTSAPSISKINSDFSFNTSAYHQQMYTVGATSLLTTHLSNDFRANYTTNYGATTFSIGEVGDAVVPPKSLFGPVPSDSFVTWEFGNLYYLQGTLTDVTQRQANLTDGLAWFRGRHSLRFGADLRYLFPHVDPLDYAEAVIFDTKYSLGVPLPGYASMPAADQVAIQQSDAMTLVYPNVSLYALDSWRVTPKLTLDYGLRWEVNPPPHGTHSGDLMYVDGWQDKDPVTGEVELKLLPPGTPAYATVYRSFAPRLGVAYQLRGKAGWETVLRGGWGIFYDLGNATAAATANSYPNFRINVLPSATDPNQSVPYPFAPGTLAPPAPPSSSPFYPPYSSFNAVMHNFSLPRVQQWNATIQQSLGNDQVFTLSYVGSAGSHMLRTFIYTENGEIEGLFNSPDFPSADIYVTRNDGQFGDSSDYNGLQVQFQRRMSRGLQILSNYTWSHAIDTNSDDYNPLSLYSMDTPGQTRGNSDNDRRHVFNLGLNYELPKLRAGGNAAVNTLEKVFVNGWAINSIFKVQSGAPFTVLFERSLAPYDQLTVPFRPDFDPTKPLWILTLDPVGNPSGGGMQLNPAAFSIPASCLTVSPQDCQNGNEGRNQLRGPGAYQLDMTVRRVFPLTERVKLECRADFLNVLNHVNWANPYNNFADVSTTTDQNGRPITIAEPDSSFGTINSNLADGISGGLASIYQFGGPRQIQFALKVSF
ncbi:MAG: Plug domain-containing protein [Bryobacteraceae bacterium]